MSSNHAELAAIRASFANPALQNAARAQQEGRSGAAKAIAEQFLRENPGDLLAMTIAAEAAQNLGEFDTAETMLREVLDRIPGFLRASMLLAKGLTTQLRLREAILVAEEALEQDPANPMVLRFLARLRADAGDVEETITLYDRLLTQSDANSGDWVTYAQFLRVLGRKDESLAAFRRALELDPQLGSAWWGLSYYFPDAIDESDVDTIETALTQASDGAPGTGLLHIALSVVADRRGDHEAVFRAVARGKRLQVGSQPADPDILSAKIDRAIGDYTPELFAAKASAGATDPAPIFIVGMPRSGSTLTERILGRHSLIEATGELQVMPRLVEGLRRRVGPDRNYSSLLASLPSEELTELGQWYLDRSREFRRTDKPHFVDKLNVNWVHVGLIRLILPNAKILDVRRNALDCCWSNFKLLFGDGYANDLRDLGRYYRDYVRLVEHVARISPGAILPVRYEGIVDDIESATRRMLEFIGLDFEPECVDFHLSTDPVATPSSEQVRRPLNREGIGASKPYLRWLGPLIEELGPLADPVDQ